MQGLSKLLLAFYSNCLNCLDSVLWEHFLKCFEVLFSRLELVNQLGSLLLEPVRACGFSRLCGTWRAAT